MKSILAYDLGTSGVKVSLYEESGRLLAASYRTYSTLHSGEGLREQRPMDWWNCFQEAVKEMAECCDMKNIAAIGGSGHSLGVIAVDSEGNLLSDTTPIWSDTRAIAQANQFFEFVDYRQWYEVTGNGFPRHLYALFKIMWMRENMPEIYENTSCFLGSKDYINLKLTGEMATDVSYASGSGAYSLIEEKYIDEYVEVACVSKEKLPCIAMSDAVIGYVTEQAAEELGIRPGIPVVAGGVDNACMTLGANCWQSGDGYASLGSSAWVTVCTDEPAVNFDAKTYTFAHCVKGKYLPSVGIFSSGTSLEWMIRNCHLGTAQGDNVYANLSELVDSAPAGANGLLFVPNLAGGSSFDPSPDVRGLFAGMDLKHTEADVARAVYEGIAMHLRCAHDALKVGTSAQDKLLLVGGAAKSKEWRQIYASVFGLPVVKTAVIQDAASLGAAALAAKGAGIWNDYSFLNVIHGDGEITFPNQEDMDFYKQLLTRYKKVCKLTQEIAEIMHAEKEG